MKKTEAKRGVPDGGPYPGLLAPGLHLSCCLLPSLTSPLQGPGAAGGKDLERRARTILTLTICLALALKVSPRNLPLRPEAGASSWPPWFTSSLFAFCLGRDAPPVNGGADAGSLPRLQPCEGPISSAPGCLLYTLRTGSPRGTNCSPQGGRV